MPWRLLHDFVTSTAVYYTQSCTCFFATWGRAWEQRGKRWSGQYHVECRATSNAFASGRCRFPSNAALQACTRWEIPLSSERLVTKPGRSFTPFGFKGFPPICESPRILRMWVNTKLIKLQVCRSPSHSGSERDWGWAWGRSQCTLWAVMSLLLLPGWFRCESAQTPTEISSVPPPSSSDLPLSIPALLQAVLDHFV